MKEATSLEEARSFFLSNSSGSIICKKNDQEKECDCYPDAEEFYKD